MATATSVKSDPVDDRRSARRQAIVEAAAIRFAREGYAECDMEGVAADCGVAKGTLYLYFPGKQELFFACSDWGMRRMQQAVRSAADSVDDPLRKIAKGIRAYLQFFDEHPEYVELLIQERAMFKDRKQPTYFEHRKANIGYWRDLYRQLLAEGRLRSDMPVERIVDNVGSLLYGTMFLTHFVGRDVPLDEQAKALLKVLLQGIVSDQYRDRLDSYLCD